MYFILELGAHSKMRNQFQFHATVHFIIANLTKTSFTETDKPSHEQVSFRFRPEPSKTTTLLTGKHGVGCETFIYFCQFCYKLVCEWPVQGCNVTKLKNET